MSDDTQKDNVQADGCKKVMGWLLEPNMTPMDDPEKARQALLENDPLNPVTVIDSEEDLARLLGCEDITGGALVLGGERYFAVCSADPLPKKDTTVYVRGEAGAEPVITGRVFICHATGDGDDPLRSLTPVEADYALDFLRTTVHLGEGGNMFSMAFCADRWEEGEP